MSMSRAKRRTRETMEVTTSDVAGKESADHLRGENLSSVALLLHMYAKEPDDTQGT